ncbi:MAG: hypothetical protein AAFN77_17705, partial [Planctomycetota bacterium]
ETGGLAPKRYMNQSSSGPAQAGRCWTFAPFETGGPTDIHAETGPSADNDCVRYGDPSKTVNLGNRVNKRSGGDLGKSRNRVVARNRALQLEWAEQRKPPQP